MEESSSSASLSLSSVGFIVWLVFLILKCCNQSNPDYEWLTWFWVWFPLWLPIAVEVAIGSVALVIFKIVKRRG